MIPNANKGGVTLVVSKLAWDPAVIRGPIYINFDLSMFNRFFICYGLILQRNGEYINASNSLMFRLNNTRFSNRKFGRISSQKNDPREMQVALRLTS